MWTTLDLGVNITVVFIGHMCLLTERKYALIKKYALNNKYVRLLTRLCGIMIEQITLSLTHALGVINNGVKYNNIIAVQP